MRGVKLEAKLKQIVLPEVTFDNLPLGEVLRVLSDESVKRDPDKAGVNFLINPNFRAVALTGEVDPATGLPLAAQTEQFDVAAVAVKFNLPLRNVTMKDLLDAIVTVADRPIEYVLEDYAVVFSAKPETVAGQAVMVARAGMQSRAGPASRSQAHSSPRWSRSRHLPAARRLQPADKFTRPRRFNWLMQSRRPSILTSAPARRRSKSGRLSGGRREAGDFWNACTIAFNDHHTVIGSQIRRAATQARSRWR